MRFDAILKGPALTADSLQQYLAEHDIVIPQSLKNQLLEQNGGSASPELNLEINGSEEVFSSMMGLHTPGNDASGELSWKVEIFRGRIPDHTVPFADDPFGNLFLIDSTDAPDGRVWFWDHEEEGTPEAATLIADSLKDFLSQLIVPDDQ